MTDQELDAAYRNRAALSPEQRAAVEAAHAEMVARQNRERGLPSPVQTPAPGDYPDPVESAATPIPTDPTPQPAPQSPRDAYAERLRRAGFSPDQAEFAADFEATQPYAFRAPESDETLAAAAEYISEQDRQEQALENQLDAVYGPRPGGWPRRSKPQRKEADPNDRIPKNPEDYRIFERGGDRGVPGPATDDGRPATLPPQFQDAEQSAEYYVRPRHPKTGALMPSQADLAMMARGFVPVYTPDGKIAYSSAANYDGPGGIQSHMSPHARRNADFTEGKRADGTPNIDPRTGEVVAPKWERVVVQGPLGPQMVLRPTAATRQKNAERDNRAAATRVAVRIGADPEAMLDPAARGEAIRLHRERDLKARRDFMRTRNMLAGGSHNINTGNAGMFNQLAMMSPEEQIRQLQYALPGGELRAQVDARQLDMAARLAQNAVTGALAGTAAGPLAQAQADALGLKNAADRAAQRRQIEDDMAEQYAASGWFGYDDFTLEEQQEAIDTLVNVHRYSLPEAQAAVDRIADNRRATQPLPRGGVPSDG